jgi:tRNA(fMet)-specific endonuclease VapC
MDPTILGLILDSSMAIEAERQGLNVAEFLKSITRIVGNNEVALSSVTVAELAHGIHRANSAERRVGRRAFLDELKAALPIYAFTDITAELVGRIGAESSARGVNIPFDDLLIGACALERGYAIATRNIRHTSK